MKTNKVIRIEDGMTMYQTFTYTSKKMHELEIIFGDVATFFDVGLFERSDYFEEIKSLFPKGRVNPIYLENVTPRTVVVLGLRQNHFLIDTTFSSDNFTKEVIYDTNRNKLNYIFFNFKQEELTIKPKITQDSIGLLKYFSENLEDNQIRNTVLHLMSSPKPPKDTLKRLLLERAENFIVYEGDVFALKYNGGKTIRIKNDVPVRDMVYLIHHKETTSNVAELWGKLRNIKYDDDTKATNNFQKSKSRFLKEILLIEEKAKVPENQRFSGFVDKYIKIDSGRCSITYEAPEKIHCEIDIPDNLHE